MAERRLAEEKAAMEKAIAEQRAWAEAKFAEEKAELEKTLAEQRALAKQMADEEKAAAERAIAQERALAEAKARALEEALVEEKAKAQEEVARERAALEKALAEEKAAAEEKERALESARAQEKALSEQKAQAEKLAKEREQALARERVLAHQRELEQQKALAEERSLMAAKEAALAKQRTMAQEAAAAHEQELEKERKRAEAREKAFAQHREAHKGLTPVIQIVHPGQVAQPVPEPMLAAPKPAPVKSPAEPGEAKAEAEGDGDGQTAAEKSPSKDSGKPDKPKRSKPSKPRRASRKHVLIPLFCLLGLILSAGGTVVFMASRMGRTAPVKAPVLVASEEAKVKERKYLQSGWRDDAKQVLTDFLAAETAAGKAAFSIDGAAKLAEMDKFYGSNKINDSDTPISGFSALQLPDEDMKRGIFRMRYDRPPHFEMGEFFRPLAPLDVQYGVREPDLLLSSMAKSGNYASDPVKVEVFFKRGPDGLRIDWDTFVQTKYRLFRGFTELAAPGSSRVFRLFIVEDVPESGRAIPGTKTYRMADPAHKTDTVRIAVPIDSEMGRALSILNWRGVKNARPKTRTATLELEWTNEAAPSLQMKRFICWEFLGIGGQSVAPAPKAPGN
ncbi:hypothetical protein [Luteolibacter marinus]|uniref:hypothetical protein n=1 Tax=Luteolibacter marinus TaxID=2776705 RepID=UPI001866F2EB|nr:hypothetical protein [Luteolibacter marinus]